MKISMSVLLWVFLLFTSCGIPQETQDIENQPLERGTLQPDSQYNWVDYIGLSRADASALAQENNTTIRVVMRDGTPITDTVKYVEGRINVELERGVVIGFTVE